MIKQLTTNFTKDMTLMLLIKCKVFFFNGLTAAFFLLVIALSACKRVSKVYKSSCDADRTYKQVDFSKLVNSIENYDKKYVEVSGTYVEGKGQSALVNDSVFVDHSSKRSLWIDFNQDCTLYLEGTRIGLFVFNDGTFTQINKKKITIRGRINVQHKGHSNSYQASLDRISYLKL